MTTTNELIIKEIQDQNFIDLLAEIKLISEKLEAQSSYFQSELDRQEYETTDEYKAEQIALQKKNEELELQVKELEEQRHQELITAMDNVATVAGDETTSTTLIESFESFKDTYDNNVSEFNEMIWVVFITALFITAFKQLGNQIWRV